jgi:hypothetical protein
VNPNPNSAVVDFAGAHRIIRGDITKIDVGGCCDFEDGLRPTFTSRRIRAAVNPFSTAFAQWWCHGAIRTWTIRMHRVSAGNQHEGDTTLVPARGTRQLSRVGKALTDVGGCLLLSRADGERGRHPCDYSSR